MKYEEILNRFPNLELSYESFIHNKVQINSYSICLAIPKGIKYFAWFTYYKEENVCILLQINKNKIISDMTMYNVPFHSDLAMGTIVQGIVNHTNDMRCFFITDILYYCGKNVSKKSLLEKTDIYSDLFEHKLGQSYYNEMSVLFGLPLMAKTDYELQKAICGLSYPIQMIQYKKELIGGKCKIFNINYDNLVKSYNVFLIKPDVQNDIYNLYCICDNKEFKYGIAHIPSYEKSVLMNKLFRNIRENNNLDYLEESDDDDDFQNINDDKFVDIDKSIKMRCIFNKKFNRWEPVEPALNSDNIVNKNNI